MGSSADSQCQFEGCHASEVDGRFCKAHSTNLERRLRTTDVPARCHMCGTDNGGPEGLEFSVKSQVWTCRDGRDCLAHRALNKGCAGRGCPWPFQCARCHHAVDAQIEYDIDYEQWRCRSDTECDARQGRLKPAPEASKGPEEFKGKIDGGGVKGSMRKMKLPLNLIPPLFIQMVALVLAFGAKKYAKNNWLRGMSVDTVLESVKRHIQEFEEGHEYDKESLLPGLAHAACGIMFLIWFMYGPNRAEYRKMDDRQWKKPRSKVRDFEFNVEGELDRINNLDIKKVS